MPGMYGGVTSKGECRRGQVEEEEESAALTPKTGPDSFSLYNGDAMHCYVRSVIEPTETCEEMGAKRVLLINPNRYMTPPVIPLGLEYIAHSLKSQSFEVAVLDLCFSADPLSDLEQRIRGFAPEAVCVSIRNVDSVLYPGTDYFLPEIKKYIDRIRELTDAPVVVRGSGIGADPEGILNFVGANCAINGPGEATLPVLLSDQSLLRQKGRVIRGAPPQSVCPERGKIVCYDDYIHRGGLPGFETHKGCSSNCVYCMEAGTPVRFKNPSHVVCELRQLVDQGFQHLHLCDSEFNEDLDYCMTLLQAIHREKLGLRWTLYMKPWNYDGRFFELLKESGVYLVTLSAETFEKYHEYWQEIEHMVILKKKNGIRISIDFLTGSPYENEDTLKQSLDFFRRVVPDEVVINVWLRLYKRLRISSIIYKDPSLRKFLIIPEGDDGSKLSPTFYNHILIEKLRELIHNDPLFRIAGAEKVVNYQKA